MADEGGAGGVGSAVIGWVLGGVVIALLAFIFIMEAQPAPDAGEAAAAPAAIVSV